MLRPLKIRQYVEIMQAKGFSADLVLAESGIEVHQLDDSGLLVDIPQCQAVVSNMIRLTGDQGLGFEVGGYARLTDLGVVGHAILSSVNLRQAIRLWIAYSNSLVGILSSLQLVEEGPSRWALNISEVVPTGFLYNFSVEEVLVMILKLGSVLIDEDLKPASLEFSYPAPAHQELYFRRFKCPIRFNCQRTRVNFHAPDLERCFRSQDKEFNEICRLHCSRVARQIAKSGSVTARLHAILLRRPGEVPSLDETATRLGMSARTLRRHLADESISYQKLVADFRRDMACEYLLVPNMATKEVAFLLGFKDVNAFRRAFKCWTGQTVQEYCLGNAADAAAKLPMQARAETALL